MNAAGFGPLSGKLQKLGLVDITHSSEAPEGVRSDAKGYYKDGRVTLFHDRIAKGEGPGVFLHEAGEHQSMKAMLGDELYKDLNGQFDRLHAEGNEHAQAAQAAVPEGTAPEHVGSERLAYLTEHVANADAAERASMPDRVKQVAYRAIAAIRAWAYRSPFGQYAAKHGVRLQLTPRDIAALARQAAGWRATVAERQERGKPQYSTGQLLAPNGKPSNLNHAQWNQVRTPAFKAFFGYWEGAWHQKQIDGLKTIPVDFVLDNNAKASESRHPALNEAKKRLLTDKDGNVKPKAFTAPNGDEIWVSMAGLREASSGHAGVQKMRVMPVLDRLIENSHFVLALNDDKTDKRASRNVLGYRYYVAKAEIDGKQYYVKLAVREIEDGGIRRKFYDHGLSEISEATREQGTAHFNEAAGNPTAIASPTDIRHHGWHKFNGAASKYDHELWEVNRADHRLSSQSGDGVSPHHPGPKSTRLNDYYRQFVGQDVQSFKDVDENGEPTAKAVDEFKAANTGSSSTDNPDIRYSLPGETPEWMKAGQNKVTDWLLNLKEPTAKTFGLLNRTVNTQTYNARKDPDYLLAPNGKPSNLNPMQWTQVRTPEFKAFFGDWEQTNQPPIEPVELVGDEIGGSNPKEARANAKAFIGKLIRNYSGFKKPRSPIMVNAAFY